MFELSEENCLDSFQPHRAGEELGQILLGYLIIVWHDACSCATGGGSRGGGVFGPLGTTVPRGVSPREQGGPWAPATLQCQFLRDLVGFVSAFLFGFLGWMLGILSGFFCLWGWKHVVRVGAL